MQKNKVQFNKCWGLYLSKDNQLHKFKLGGSLPGRRDSEKAVVDDEFDMSEPLWRQARTVALKFYEFWTPVSFLVAIWRNCKWMHGFF